VSDVVDKKRAWIAKVLGADALATSPAPLPATPRSTADLVSRLRALGPAVMALKQAGDERFADIAKAIAAASNALKANAADAADHVAHAEQNLRLAGGPSTPVTPAVKPVAIPPAAVAPLNPAPAIPVDDDDPPPPSDDDDDPPPASDDDDDGVAPPPPPRENGATVEFDTAQTALVARINAIDAILDKKKHDLTATYVTAATAALKPDDPKPALALLAQGNAACVQVEELQPIARQYVAARAAAKTASEALTDKTAEAEKARIIEIIAKAETHATAFEFQKALETLAPVDEACKAVPEIVAQQKKYDDARKTVQDRHGWAMGDLAAIPGKRLDPRPDMQALVDELKTKYLDKADRLVKDRGVGKAAHKALQDATALMTAADPIALYAFRELYAYTTTLADAKDKADKAFKALKPYEKFVQPEIGAIQRLIDDAGKTSASGQALAAKDVYEKAEKDSTQLVARAQLLEKYDTALSNANKRLAACKTEVDKLVPVPPALSQRYTAVQAATLAPAAALFAARDWVAAEALITAAAMNAACEPVEALAKQAAAYAAALTAAKAERARLTDPLVKPEADRIDSALLMAAESAAGKLDYQTAQALLTKVAGEVSTALNTATQAAKAQKARNDSQAALGGEIPGAVAAVRALLAPLLAHPQKAAIQDRLDTIQAAIKTGTETPQAENVRQLLTAAANLCPTAQAEADRAAGFATALAAAKAAAAKLTADFIARDRTGIETALIPAAEALVKPPRHEYAAAIAALDTVEDAIKAAEMLAKRNAAFDIELEKVDAVFESVAYKGTRIETAMEDIKQKKLDAAGELAADRKFDEAEKLLDGVVTDIRTLALSLKMSGDKPPTADEMTEILQQPGGTKKLDAMVANLPETVSKAAMEAAIKIRFTLEFKHEQPGTDDSVEGAGKSKSLKKIYELMASVPEAHTRNNPSLKHLERYGGDDANPAHKSVYSDSAKKVVLACGRQADNDVTRLQLPAELTDVHPDCQSAPGPAPKYFDWTTLHEVGHAIDDKKNFMGGKAGNAAFGNWREHGADVIPVATAIASACKIDGPEGERFLVQYLTTKKDTAPPAPATKDAAIWAQGLTDAKTWCDSIRVDKALWDSASGSKKYQFEGRVYHEAYNGNWVSYDLAARAQGITGYQFRAPGEWLSELYAAYHCKKLKPSHPANAWLQTL
jgi:hypothetical protein